MEEFLYDDWKPAFIKESYEVFLDQAGRGCINNWPQLKPACAWAIAEIRKLREELKLKKENEEEEAYTSFINTCNDLEICNRILKKIRKQLK